MCNSRLMSRWKKFLTGAVICAVACIFAASSSWAAMCMVGYSSDKCSAEAQYDKSGDNNPNKCPDGTNPPCKVNPTPVPCDCVRLGYSDLGAAKFTGDINTSPWPRYARKGNSNNTAEWKCDICMGADGACLTKKGYARYKCYVKCSDEARASKNAKWDGKIYAQQFIRSQAECNDCSAFTDSQLCGTEEVSSTVNVGGSDVTINRTVAKSHFLWITKNVCGMCKKQECDGTGIMHGCYYPCPTSKKYKLENGKECCNLQSLPKMPDEWHQPEWTDKCYDTESQEAADGTTCYKQTVKTCADHCKEPDYGNGCQCVSKSCSTVAAENGKTAGSVESGVKVNTHVYKFSNSDVESIAGTCYVKHAIGCAESNCYYVTKLTCPDGSNGKNPGSGDCSCGIGCPTGYYQQENSSGKSYRTISSNYVNVQPYQEGGVNKKSCVKLNSDGMTCASEVQCYRYDQCSSIDSMLVAGGLSGCVCGNGWQDSPTPCDNPTPSREQQSNAFHPQGTALGYGAATTVTCRQYVSNCNSCETCGSSGCVFSCSNCHYGTYESDPGGFQCVQETEPTYTETDSNGGSHTCKSYSNQDCDSAGFLDQSGCSCSCPSGWYSSEQSGKVQTDKREITDNFGVSHTCYQYREKTCDDITEEGNWTTSSCDSCGQDTVYPTQDENKIGNCHKCVDKAAGQTCADLGYKDSSQSSDYQIDANTWCCSAGSGSMTTSTTTSSPTGNGTCRTCYTCTSGHTKANTCSAEQLRDYVCNYKAGAASCMYECQTKYSCEASTDWAPVFTSCGSGNGYLKGTWSTYFCKHNGEWCAKGEQDSNGPTRYADCKPAANWCKEKTASLQEFDSSGTIVKGYYYVGTDECMEVVPAP